MRRGSRTTVRMGSIGSFRGYGLQLESDGTFSANRGGHVQARSPTLEGLKAEIKRVARKRQDLDLRVFLVDSHAGDVEGPLTLLGASEGGRLRIRREKRRETWQAPNQRGNWLILRSDHPRAQEVLLLAERVRRARALVDRVTLDLDEASKELPEVPPSWRLRDRDVVEVEERLAAEVRGDQVAGGW